MEAVVLSQALREYTRAKRVAPWLLLALGCLGLAVVWPSLMHGAKPEDQYASVSSILVFRILALASAIFTTAIVSQEVEQRTIVYLLTRPIERWRLLLFRYLASVAVVALLGIIAALLTSFGAYHGVAGNPLLANDLKAIIIGAFAYGGLFLLVSLLFNRSMIICLLFAFGWETSVPNMPGDLYHVSIFSYLQAIAQHPSAAGGKLIDFASGALSTNSITEGSAWTTLTLLTIITVAVSLWWFSHFEYVPREDAE